MEVVISRFGVYLVNLNPTKGHEIKKTRPCVIVSPDEMNHNIGVVIVAPMTTKMRNYPTRVSLRFKNKNGQVVLDQMRTIDKTRLVKYLGQIDESVQKAVCLRLTDMFSYVDEIL